MRQLNFGGGPSAKTGEGMDSQQPKSKKEVMEDIIAKSKFYKVCAILQGQSDNSEALGIISGNRVMHSIADMLSLWQL